MREYLSKRDRLFVPDVVVFLKEFLLSRPGRLEEILRVFSWVENCYLAIGTTTDLEKPLAVACRGRDEGGDDVVIVEIGKGTLLREEAERQHAVEGEACPG